MPRDKELDITPTKKCKLASDEEEEGDYVATGRQEEGDVKQNGDIYYYHKGRNLGQPWHCFRAQSLHVEESCNSGETP